MTKMMRSHHFFGLGHEKGEHDGASTVVKQTLTCEQLLLNSIKLQCAADAMNSLREKCSHGATFTFQPAKKQIVKRIFWEVKASDIAQSRKWECKHIPESCLLHFVCGYSPSTMLRVRRLSCFCGACIQGKWRQCANKRHVEVWKYHLIEPKEDEEDSDDEGLDNAAYEGHHDFLFDGLSVGDNFAVNAEVDNEEGVDFYILKCISKKKHVRKAMKENWGNAIDANTHVVKGYWYQQVGNLTYFLLDEH